MQASVTLATEVLWSFVVQATMRSNRVVFAPPPGCLGLRVRYRLELLPVQEFIA